MSKTVQEAVELAEQTSAAIEQVREVFNLAFSAGEAEAAGLAHSTELFTEAREELAGAIGQILMLTMPTVDLGTREG